MKKRPLRRLILFCKGEGTFRPAFTLFELLVVLALLIMIASLGMPSVARVMEKAKFKEGVFALQTELEKTRLLAMKTGTPLLFRVQIGSNLYEVAPYQEKEESESASPSLTPGIPSPSNVNPGGQRRFLDGDAGFLGSVILNNADFSNLQGVNSGANGRFNPANSGLTSSSNDFGSTNAAGDSRLGGIQTSESDGFLGAAANPSPMYWSEPIYFYPNGRTSTAVIFLQNNGEKNRYYSEVSIRGLTGAARISSIASSPPGSPDFPSVLSPEAFARLTMKNANAPVPFSADQTDGFLTSGGEEFTARNETLTSGVEDVSSGSFIGGLQTPGSPSAVSLPENGLSNAGGGE